MSSTPQVVVEVSNHKIMKVVTEQMDIHLVLIDNDEGNISLLGTCFDPKYVHDTFEMFNMLEEARHRK